MVNNPLMNDITDTAKCPEKRLMGVTIVTMYKGMKSNFDIMHNKRLKFSLVVYQTDCK